jgi:MerR family transcriptional regulator, copper efflux regulator
MRIGALAERTGTTVPTIRFYEKVGLLRPAARRGGQRSFDNEHVHRLGFIRRCREFDFSIPEIRALLSLMQTGRSCTQAKALAEGRLLQLRRRLAELQRLEESIAGLIRECAEGCDGGAAADCVILRTH